MNHRALHYNAIYLSTVLTLLAGCKSAEGGSNQNHNGISDTDAGFPCGINGSPCCEQEACTDSSECIDGTCVARPSEVGTPCERNADCSSGICVPIGSDNVCTTPCGAQGDCLAGWNCEPMIGQPADICQCNPSSETCDGQDNDCDGIVDDGAQIGCEATEMCVAGMCECKPEIMCGDQCGCSATEVCVAQVCECKPENQCSSICVDLESDQENCGTCGSHCDGRCDGGECLTGCDAICTQPDHVCIGESDVEHQTCAPICDAEITCSPVLTCCLGGCADLFNDPNNCGACASYCSGVCINDVCI